MSTARVRLTTLWMGQYETVSNDINKSIKSITRKFVLHVLTDNVTRGSRTKLYSTVCSPRVDSDVHAVQELNQRVREYSRGCSYKRTTGQIDAMRNARVFIIDNYNAPVSRQKLKLEQAQHRQILLRDLDFLAYHFHASTHKTLNSYIYTSKSPIGAPGAAAFV